MRLSATVLGNCGRIHPSFEDWQACGACGRSPLRDARWPTGMPPYRHDLPWLLNPAERADVAAGRCRLLQHEGVPILDYGAVIAREAA